MSQQTQKSGVNIKEDDPREMYDKPPFAPQTQKSPGDEWKMDPKPDYGYDTYKGSNKLQGKIAIVTGGDSGIGRAVCLAFAREGCHVVISYLNEHKDAEETRDAILSSCQGTGKEEQQKCSGCECLLIPGDISEDSVCKAIIDKTVEKFGKIDILVNNAAYQGKAVESIEDITYERIMHTFKTNIIAMFCLSKYALPHMEKGSSIINVGSIQAYEPSHPILDYATTKGAIVNFTKGLSKFTIEKGIRCNCIAPGPVWTPLIVQSFGKEKVAEFGKHNPTERPAQPAELAPAFVFFASKDSSYVNGQVLGVTGGALTP
jgi:NAD(P)-dependent dehydrogenase (short-subunit alcohol dehydrogenase family)